MKNIFVQTLFLLTGLTGFIQAQRAITSEEYNTWISNQVDFILFDVRGDVAPDSILRPCFYTSSESAIKWADSLGCRKRLLVVCHGGVLAAQTAASIVENGYPADSVFSAGFSNITTSHFPPADTLPLVQLSTGGLLPQPLSSYQLWAMLLSKRAYRLIDIRGTAEITTGMIPGACNIVWPDPFLTQCGSFDKTADLVLYCASGNRAGRARDSLLGRGFDPQKVINFGGFSKWSSTAGVPISRSPSLSCQCIGVEKITRPHSSLSPLSVFPNPFNSATRLTFNLPKNSSGRLVIVDLRGRKIASAVLTTGIIRDGFEFRSGNIPASVYIATLFTGGKTFSTPVILAK